ncbi:MAG: hypothetical protein IJ727_10840, partial [Treponema sp.]|nr:hypothetical protein [Treponema sp.]
EKDTNNLNLFDFIRAENPETVFKTLQKEDDYFVALVLSCISESLASSLFSMFELDRQIKIQELIAKGLKISASVVKAYEESFKECLKNQVEEEKNHLAGSEKACKILQLSKISVQKEFMDALSKQNDELAAKFKEKLFFFDDIPLLSDRALQCLLREIDENILTKALKAAGEPTCEKFFRNMSEKTAAMLKENMEFMGPLRLKDALECQEFIVNIVLRLEENGKIVIQRTKEDELV